jgi:hypothetical protein
MRKKWSIRMALKIDRSLRFPDSAFFPAPSQKSGIAVHRAVGGPGRSSFEWWLSDTDANGNPKRVGTAYIIDRDGTVYEIFDPSAWAFQFGLHWPPAQQIAFEKRFIGIELASFGGLIEKNGKLYALDRVSPRTRIPRKLAMDYGFTYRGYRYFHSYEPAQLDALVQLVDSLCARFSIPRRVPVHFFAYYGEALADFEGVIGHAMVREDKSDPAPDETMWR